MTSVLSTLLLLLGGLLGGGNDLLDYVPTDAYWRAKGLPVVPEVIVDQLRAVPPGELAELAGALGGEDPDAVRVAMRRLEAAGPAALPALRDAAKGIGADAAGQARLVIGRIEAAPKAPHVRRLMAIRTLGELRVKQAAAVLQPLTGSDEMFVADYAKAALAAIEGRPAPRPRAAGVAQDVWLLPAGVRAVGAYAPRVAESLSINEALRQAAPPAGVTREQWADRIAADVIAVAEQVGNVRLDGFTFGLSGQISDRSGFAVVMARGRYDRQAVATLLERQRVPARPAGGVQVYQIDHERAVWLASDDRLVLVASPGGKDRPLEELVTAVQANAGKLKGDADMAKLIAAVDTTQPVWAAAKVTPAYRQAPGLDAFETLTLVARHTGPGTFDLTLQATGTDPAKVAAAAEGLNAQVAQVRADLKRAAAAQPGPESAPAPLRRLTDALAESLRATAAGNVVTLTAGATSSRAELLDLMLRAATAGRTADDAGREGSR